MFSSRLTPQGVKTVINSSFTALLLRLHLTGPPVKSRVESQFIVWRACAEKSAILASQLQQQHSRNARQDLKLNVTAGFSE